MKKAIIIEMDSFFLDRIIIWLKENNFHKKYNLFILVKQYNIKEYKKQLNGFEGLNCIAYEDLYHYKAKSKLDLSIYHQFNKKFLNNHLTARFLDRSGYYPYYGIGNQNAFCHYTSVAYNMIQFLIEHDIEFVCFRNTPHNIDEWMLSQTTEFLDIDFYSLEDYIFPWLFTIKKGCLTNTEPVFDDLNFNKKEELQAHITNCIEIVSGTYEDAIPTYEKKRMGKGYFKFYNPFSKIGNNVKRPHQFYTRTKNFMYYKKNSQVFNLKQMDYLIFFLQYQPERSTMPEGFEFVDQFYTIRIISEMLPEGVKLLVKEHPSMFTKISEPKFRNVYNYELINRLDNVNFVSMDMDSFSLIDQAMAVSTIKGTVALEAYIRSKPVIVFGKTNLRLPGVHNFSNIYNLKKFIDDVVSNKVKVKNQMEELMASCLKTSISGITTRPEDTKDYSFTREVRENASYKLLTKLLNHKLSQSA